MKVQALGHVVLKVRNKQRAEKFYSEVLGIPIVARLEPTDELPMSMTFFSLGNHHDLAVQEVGEDAPDAPDQATGLAHVAFNIGNSTDILREAKAHLERHGVKTVPIDHEVTHSLYFRDPDGNPLEVYVDVSEAWKREPQRIAQGKPLAL